MHTWLCVWYAMELRLDGGGAERRRIALAMMQDLAAEFPVQRRSIANRCKTSTMNWDGAWLGLDVLTRREPYHRAALTDDATS